MIEWYNSNFFFLALQTVDSDKQNYLIIFATQDHFTNIYHRLSSHTICHGST